jgi:hypothetical protein
VPYKDPEVLKAYRKQYRLNNLEKLRKADKLRHSKRTSDDHKIRYAQEKLRTPKEVFIFRSAKHRAKSRNLDFDIDVSDIIIPEYCPITGIKIEESDNGGCGYSSPSLDRIDNSKGYVKGNVSVISGKANMCKSDLTVEQITQLYKYVTKHQRETTF